MIRVAVIGSTSFVSGDLKLVSKYSDYDALVVSYMSCTMLAKCALGIDEDFAGAFLNNKKIYVFSDGLQYKRINDKIIFQMYSIYRRALQSFGVKFINSAEEIKL